MATNDKKLVTYGELYKYSTRVLYKTEFDIYVSNQSANSDLIIFNGEIRAKNKSIAFSLLDL